MTSETGQMHSTKITSEGKHIAKVVQFLSKKCGLYLFSGTQD